MRLIASLLIAGTAIAAEPLTESPRPVAAGEAGAGRMVAAVEGEDVDGRVWKLAETAREAKAVVVAFNSPTCPLSAKMLPSLRALEAEYAGKGVAFVYVNPTASDTAEAIAAVRKAHGLAGMYVHDKTLAVAVALGAQTTTEVFVLDAARTLTYRGAVDDQYGVGYAKDAPEHRWLRDALEETVAGRRPRVAATTAPGCAIDLPKVEVAAGEVTWHGRVSRILQTNCQDCHRDGGIGPFPLMTMEDAVSHAGEIRKAVGKGLMPPWFAAREAGVTHSPFVNDRSLPERDKADLLGWLEGGRAAGDPADAPVARVWADAEWVIGKPDAIYEIPREIEVKATGKMGYVHLIVDPGLTEDRWVKALEVLPTARAQVHHVLVFVLSQDADRRKIANGDNFFAAYVPGSSSMQYAEGYAKKLPKGSKLLFQLHYTPTGLATVDRTRLGVKFADGVPKHEVLVAAAKNTRFAIPPGAADHVERGRLDVPRPADILAFMPHMHVRGKSFKYEIVRPGVEKALVLDVPRYDFNWQLLYRLAEPLHLPAGSRLEVTASFDNSTGNPANPDPARTVRWGEQTDDEMLIGYVEYVFSEDKPAVAAAPSGSAGGSAGASPQIQLTGKSLGALGKLLDKDGDGRVSKVEAGNEYGALHSALDGDGDGFVTGEEARRVARQRKESGAGGSTP